MAPKNSSSNADAMTTHGKPYTGDSGLGNDDSHGWELEYHTAPAADADVTVPVSVTAPSVLLSTNGVGVVNHPV